MVVGLDVEVFLQKLRAARVVGVLRANGAEASIGAALAAARGGLTCLEITYTTPDAARAIRALRDQLPRDVLIGAGTVMNADQAREALDSGADFLVSPHLGERVLELALERNAIYVPGAITPTEIARALELGAQVLKLFPIGSSGGRAFLKDLLGPFPQLKVMVTGGVTPKEVSGYIQTGALAVGLGSNFFPKAALENGDWAGVEAATRAALLEVGA